MLLHEKINPTAFALGLPFSAPCSSDLEGLADLIDPLPQTPRFTLVAGGDGVVEVVLEHGHRSGGVTVKDDFEDGERF